MTHAVPCYAGSRDAAGSHAGRHEHPVLGDPVPVRGVVHDVVLVARLVRDADVARLFAVPRHDMRGRQAGGREPLVVLHAAHHQQAVRWHEVWRSCMCRRSNRHGWHLPVGIPWTPAGRMQGALRSRPMRPKHAARAATPCHRRAYMRPVSPHRTRANPTHGPVQRQVEAGSSLNGAPDAAVGRPARAEVCLAMTSTACAWRRIGVVCIASRRWPKHRYRRRPCSPERACHVDMHKLHAGRKANGAAFTTPHIGFLPAPEGGSGHPMLA